MFIVFVFVMEVRKMQQQMVAWGVMQIRLSLNKVYKQQMSGFQHVLKIPTLFKKKTYDAYDFL